MSKNYELRENVRLIKAKQGSFLNWLNGWYELSEVKEQRLQEIIDTLQE